MTKEKGIRIYVSVKHMGNVAKKIKTYPLTLSAVPHTLRELIAETVKVCVLAYRERAVLAKNPKPLTEEQLEGMQELGRFAFGVHYNENTVNEEKAIRAATEAAEDGIVRVFKDNTELCELDAPLSISENDVFTFIRLTMLSGRMW